MKMAKEFTMTKMINIFVSFSFASMVSASLQLTIASSGGNMSSPLKYGMLYEDIYHSGDGGMYAELIRNRAFQGSSSNGQASTARNTEFWTPIGGVNLSIDTTSPSLSSSLPYQMAMIVPKGTVGTVGFYNTGFWGFNVDVTKRYIASLYMRGSYNGEVNFHFQSLNSGAVLGSTSVTINQTSSEGWIQIYSPTFQPSKSAADANNTFYFTFNGTELAGETVHFNLFSVFKQTFNNRNNGLREDLAESLVSMNQAYLRLPGGNNMEGNGAPYEWKWNLTIGDLKNRPGRPGTWGDVNTDGLGLLEMMQWCTDMGLTTVLGVWAGLYLDGTIIAQSALQPYVDSVMHELEFLLGDSSTTYGALRASLGYSEPFTIDYVEIGNEDYLNGGTSTYYSYRFDAFYNAIRSVYPSLHLITTINPSPVTTSGSEIDLHIYGNEDYFVGLFGTFDQASRKYPVFVAEYAATQVGSGSGQCGAQTLGMACAEAIFLLGCERNSDVILGTSYGALIKSYNEAPDTVSVIKHTANEILLTMSYYVQKLFADYQGTETLQVNATGGGFGPVYWSATKSSTATILKMVNYNGTLQTIVVSSNGSSAMTATLVTLTAPSSISVNNLPGLGGVATNISTTTIKGSGGTFSVPFTSSYEIAILSIPL